MSTVIPAQRFVGSSVPRVGGPADPHRLGQLRRRHPAARHAARRVRAQPGRPRPDHVASTSTEARALPESSRSTPAPSIQALLAPGAAPLTLFPGLPASPFTILATDKVRLVGDPIALVVAETRYIAEDAAELVEVDYDDLPTVAVLGRRARPDEHADLRGRGQQRPRQRPHGEPRRRRRRVRQGRPRRRPRRSTSTATRTCRWSAAAASSTSIPTTGSSRPRLEPGRAPREDDALRPARARPSTRSACSAATSAARSA